ncbi:MAG: ribonuclease H family protein [Turicibacter sp.]
MNTEKMQFGQNEVMLLGVTINGKFQITNSIKKNEVLTYPEHLYIKIEVIFGAGWLVQILHQRLCNITAKLTSSLRGDSKTWKWTEALQEDFDKTKQAILTMQSIFLPNYDKGFVLKTDASNFKLRAVLMQEVDGELLPLQWANKKIIPAEMKHGISEKEMLAIFWAVKKFGNELRGRRFKLVTDHKALKTLKAILHSKQ